MKRRDFLKASAQGGSLALLGSQVRADGASAVSTPVSGAGLPNILHIMADQQQWGTIAGRSQCNTPNLTRLAAQGVLFSRSYTPCAVCCPARAMLQSGAYHWHNGVYNQVHSSPSVSRDMRPDVVTYSMRLKEAGYSLGYVGKWHASYTRTPLDFGYDRIGAPVSYNRRLLEGLDYIDERSREKLKSTTVRWMSWPGSEPFTMWGYEEGSEEHSHPYGIAQTGIRMLNEIAAGDKPWLLEVQFPEPHDPYMPLKPYLDRYDPSSIPVARSFREERFEKKPNLHRRESETWGQLSEKDYRESRAHYYAYCEMLDAQIGRVLEALDKTGQAGNTVVVFTTDHGDMVGAHRMWIKGIQPYEECYRIPMIIRWPGRIAPGTVEDRLVQSHFLAHTYVDIAGAEPLPFADGRSLLPLFDRAAAPDWPDMIMCAYYGGEYTYTQRMLVTERHKYVFNGFDFDECYDLVEDPDELFNRVDDPACRPVVDDMRARLYELMDRFEDPFGHKQNRVSIGEPPNRYGGPRFLPLGTRL